MDDCYPDDHDLGTPAPRGREPFDASRHLLPPGAELPAGLTEARTVELAGGEIVLSLTACLPGYGEADLHAGRGIPRATYRLDGAEDGEGEATREQIEALLLAGEALWSEIDGDLRDQDCAAHEARCERAMEGL